MIPNLLAALVALSASAAPPATLQSPDHPTRALLLGGSRPGHGDIGLSAGTPWTTAAVQVGLPGGWTPVLEAQSAKFVRWQPAVGLAKRWLDGRWRLSGTALMGWTLQGDPLPFRGPAGALSLKTGRAAGRVLPYLHLGVRGSRTEDRVVDTQGAILRRAPRWETTLTGALGAGVVLGPRLGLDLGIDLPWVDVPKPSIPGVHLGLQTGWGATP